MSILGLDMISAKLGYKTVYFPEATNDIRKQIRRKCIDTGFRFKNGNPIRRPFKGKGKYGIAIMGDLKWFLSLEDSELRWLLMNGFAFFEKSLAVSHDLMLL